MGEWKRLGAASQDPAIAFLVLLPLGLIHVAGHVEADNAARGVVAQLLQQALGPAAQWAFLAFLAVVSLWAIGRIRALDLPWRGGAGLTVAEGVLFGLALAPVLRWLTSVIPMEAAPLSLLTEGPATDELLRGLAISAGAGLYEELVFRAALLGGLAVLIRALLTGLGWQELAPTVGTGAALILSAAGFALAHAAGDEFALEPQVFAFRFLAGILLGGLFAWRGLGVVAYAHFTYDAVLILPGI
ncbi:MAG TPA: CPBP family glutamic-type intramembrane protease [Planctomycetota bacterium]